MKFEVRKNDLSEAIKKVLPFVGKFNNMPNINFYVDKNNLTLIAQNEQSRAIKKIKIDGDCDFSFALDGREIANIVDTFINVIEFTKNENKLILKENKSKMNLVCKENNIEIEKENIEFKELNFNLIKEGIQKTIDFVDNKVGVMSGINFKFLANTITVQATNGYFGSIYENEQETEFESDFILPINIAKELLKIESDFVKLGKIGTQIVFNFANFEIKTTTISGIYPKLAQIFSFPLKETLELDKKEMLCALKKAQNVISKDNFVIKMDITKENTKFYIENQNIGLNEELQSKYDGEEKNIKVNCEYLPIVIQNCDDIINIRFSDENPRAFYFNNKNNKMVLMLCS